MALGWSTAGWLYLQALSPKAAKSSMGVIFIVIN